MSKGTKLTSEDLSKQRQSFIRERKLSISYLAYSMSTPALVLIMLVLIFPVLAVFGLSFTDWLFGAKYLNFIGIKNYAQMLGDRVFWKSLSNTFIYVGTVVPGSFIIGLVVAILIQSSTSLRGFYRAVYFLPVVASLLAMAIVWEILLHPTVGLLNLFLKNIGITGRDWLNESSTVLMALAGIGIWQMSGFSMVLFLSGLVGIPVELYEAAEIDGADSAWDRFRTVTWPMLGPVSLFVLVICAIRSFQVFDTVKVLTRGGPNKASEVLLHTMYTEGFAFMRSGYGSAITVVFLVFILGIALAQMKLLEKRIHY